MAHRVHQSHFNDEPEGTPPMSDNEPDSEPEEEPDFEEPSFNTDDEDFIDEFSLPSMDSADDQMFFDDDDESMFHEELFADFDLCDEISEPPESPPESPTPFDEPDFDDMSFFSGDPDDEEDWEGSFSDDEFDGSEPPGSPPTSPPMSPPESTTNTATNTAGSVTLSSGTAGEAKLPSPLKHHVPIHTRTPPPPPPPTHNTLPNNATATSSAIGATSAVAIGPTTVPVEDQITVAEHPTYAKYFKMLKYGLPISVVKSKMNQDGYDNAVLDLPATTIISKHTVAKAHGTTDAAAASEEQEEDDNPEKVALIDHVTYGRFFKMLKFGLSLEVVQAKMTQEGLNSAILSRNPTDLYSVSAAKPKIGGAGLKGLRLKKKEVVEEVSKIRKKKLFWKGVDASKVTNNEDSLWHTNEENEIELDQEEFNRLFTEQTEVKNNINTAKEVTKPKKPKGIHLIDMKRAQNAAIALSRIKIPYEEIRQKLTTLDDEHLSTDQLVSLCEYLPTLEESKILSKYNGDMALLGQAEKYMIAMLNFPTAGQRIGCMIYKQLFASRAHEAKVKLQKIESACDDVKLSTRLKKVLKIILKVGNSLNDGEQHKGFSVDSLLKLKDAKAFDKKTSILQYVIVLIHRNDADALLFPEELSHVAEASRLIFDAIEKDKNALKKEFDLNHSIITKIQQNEPNLDISSVLEFYTSKATTVCEELDKRCAKVKAKFSSVLSYFGEDATLSSTEFFTTLNKFIVEFTVTRESVDRLRKLETRKLKAMSMPRVKVTSTLNKVEAGSGGVAGEQAAAAAGKPLKRCVTVEKMESTTTSAAEEVVVTDA